ncbi:TPA: phage tail protein, partial [Yersinia enterocolitica]
MATVITRAFEHWQAGQVLNNLPARPDTIIFAHIPGLDPTAEINPDEGIPADGQIVHRDAVAQYGMINDSAVAYSVVLDTRIGDFTFNWIGLVDAASNTLCMIVHTPAQQKIATANGVQGNNITRTFLMEFAGAAEASQITVSAQAWQIDFSARLRGIDEVCRLANLDYYGHAAFFGDGFSVSKDGDKYRVKAGLAYIGGIRALLADDVLLEAAAGNVVYADVSYQGSVLSEFAPIIHLGVKNSAGDFGDYTDANGFT